MLAATLLVALQLSQAPPSAQTVPPDTFSGTAGLDILAEDRQSLRGITRLMLSFNVPDDIATAIDADVLRSTVAFRLQQAGIDVVTTRQVDDPVLTISVRVVAERLDGRETGRVLYRTYADLLQLVRLPDFAGGARLMLASTWHAGSFGAIDDDAIASLRDRIAEIIDTFTSDHRSVNAP